MDHVCGHAATSDFRRKMPGELIEGGLAGVIGTFDGTRTNII
jgi:hypothetical protein